MQISKVLLGLAGTTLVLVISLDVYVHGKPAQARSQGYARAKYYTKDQRRPFTFVSRYTLSSEEFDHTLRMEFTEAEDAQGRSIYVRKQFAPASDVVPTIETARLVERPDGAITLFYWSKWQQALGKPMLVAYGANQRMIDEHTLPENNCISPEPALTFLRHESVKVGGEEYPSAVVRYQSEDTTMTTWHAMTAGLGCLELKSVASYTSPPDQERGITVHEPVSLILGEPDPNLYDVRSRISSTSVEVIPLDRWEDTVKSRTNEYEKQYQRASVSQRALQQ